MYRGRLDADLSGAALDFVSSDADRRMIPFDVTATKAHILMLYKGGIISQEHAVAILSALQNAVVDAAAGTEDIHEALERAVSQLVGEDAGGRIQTARSRNDQVATAIRMTLRHDTHQIQTRILNMAGTLLTLSEQHRTTVMPLYTHLQHAQAGLLSHYLLAYTDALLRDYDRFDGMFTRLNSNPLGSGPVGGTTLPIDRLATGRMLGFSNMIENSLDATSSRDYMSEFVSCVAIMMGTMSRMAEDMVLWSSQEFSFVRLSDSVSSPSSAMPQKKNPDVLELVRGKAGRVIGDMAAVLAIQKGLASGYGRDLQETKAPAWSASEMATGTLDIMSEVVSGLYIDQNRMANAIRGGYLAALDVAENLVLRGVSFRQAHQAVGLMVATADAAGKHLEDMDEALVRKACSLDTDMVLEAIAECAPPLKRKTSLGGASLVEQNRMMRQRKRQVSAYTKRLAERHRRYTDPIKSMEAEIDQLGRGT